MKRTFIFSKDENLDEKAEGEIMQVILLRFVLMCEAKVQFRLLTKLLYV